MNRTKPLTRRKGLTRSGALARKTPMPRNTSELRRRVAARKRNTKRRDPAKATAQRHAVMERANGRCEFEIDLGPGLGWTPCFETMDLQTCHLIRRHLCGAAIYDPDVAIAGCDVCHAAFDHRTHPSHWDRVRAPEGAIARAMTAIRKAEADRAARGLAVVPIPDPSFQERSA